VVVLVFYDNHEKWYVIKLFYHYNVKYSMVETVMMMTYYRLLQCAKWLRFKNHDSYL